MMMMNIPAVWLYFLVGALLTLFIAVLFYVLKRREYLWLLNTANERLAQQTASQEEKTLQINELQNKTAQLNSDLQQAIWEREKLSLELEMQQQSFREKEALLLNAKEVLELQFKDLAQNIFDEKSKLFLQQNQTGINELLSPVKQQMSNFEKLIQQTHQKDNIDRALLNNELKNLQQLNVQLNQEAHSLTMALTGGNNKTQGLWGEMILEKVLEHSGLVKNRDYSLQVSIIDDNGQKKQPDAIIRLPENHCLIIDAKVSLTDYMAYTNAENEEQQQIALKNHQKSILRHIDELSLKEYQNLPLDDLSPDFVLMFIPFESAYIDAIKNNDKIIHTAFEKNVVLVSPNTLLTIMRTVANVWRYEQQNANAEKIAKAGGNLYNKLVNLTETLEKLGKTIETVNKDYAQAINQLHIGKGNLCRQAEQLRLLGAKTTKRLPEKYIGDDLEGDMLINDE